MTIKTLEYLNNLWDEVNARIDELMGDHDMQLVMEFNGSDYYWLASHEITTRNGIPIMTFCSECNDITLPSYCKDYKFVDWQDFKEKVFDLASEDYIQQIYIEHI